MQPADDTRRRPDGSIDIDHYKAIADAERREALQHAGRRVAAAVRRLLVLSRAIVAAHDQRGGAGRFRMRPISCSAGGSSPSTMRATPCAVGWIPSFWLRLRSAATPSSRNG